MQHRVRSLPVVFEIDNGSGGVNRVHCAGDYLEVLRDMKLLRYQSLPQNVATKQGGNHAIAEDCAGRPSVVGAGHGGGVGDVLCGSEAGQ